MPTLHYISDPMCSWCFAFEPTITAIQATFADQLSFQYVMGGLAPDSDEIMPLEIQQYIQENWRAIEEQTDARFNWDFWKKNEPRRSTYPACRAVIAAGYQNPAWMSAMFQSIQIAYYRQAMNPSDLETIIEVADGIKGLDMEKFLDDVRSEAINDELEDHFRIRRRLGSHSFPSLVLEISGTQTLVQAGWGETSAVLKSIASRLP